MAVKPHMLKAISVDEHNVPATVVSFWLEVIMLALFKYQALNFVFSKLMTRKFWREGYLSNTKI